MASTVHVYQSIVNYRDVGCFLFYFIIKRAYGWDWNEIEKLTEGANRVV